MCSVTIQPDDKDWTWVLQRRCTQCGVDVPTTRSAPRGRHPALGAGLAAVLPREDVAVRPAPQVWSPLEYACHVRDVYRLFDGRLRAMLTEDDPQFANWDQDETAIAERYAEQDPATVARTAHRRR